MRRHTHMIAEEPVDQRALARVQERNGEPAKVTKRPEQINALPGRKLNPYQSLGRFKEQKTGLQPVQKHA